MAATTSNVLVIGFGNPGRQDDGLGPACAEALTQRQLPGLTVDADYQLNVEDAAEVARHAAVVFIDAACQGPEPFSFDRVQAGETISFSTHSVAPDGLIGLARELFNAETPAYLLGIRGYAFNEFGEGLTERAQANLAAALEFIEPVIRQRNFEQGLTRVGKADSPST